MSTGPRALIPSAAFSPIEFKIGPNSVSALPAAEICFFNSSKIGFVAFPAAMSSASPRLESITDRFFVAFAAAVANGASLFRR